MSSRHADGGAHALVERVHPTPLPASSFEAEVFVVDWAVASEEPPPPPSPPDRWGRLRNEGIAVSLDV